MAELSEAGMGQGQISGRMARNPHHFVSHPAVSHPAVSHPAVSHPAISQPGGEGRPQPPVMLVNDVADDRHAPKPWTWVGVIAGIVAAGYWAIQLL